MPCQQEAWKRTAVCVWHAGVSAGIHTVYWQTDFFIFFFLVEEEETVGGKERRGITHSHFPEWKRRKATHQLNPCLHI